LPTPKVVRRLVSSCRRHSLFSRSLNRKGPIIEDSALVAPATITLVFDEWWHWVAVNAAIVVVRVLLKK